MRPVLALLLFLLPAPALANQNPCLHHFTNARGRVPTDSAFAKGAYGDLVARHNEASAALKDGLACVKAKGGTKEEKAAWAKAKADIDASLQKLTLRKRREDLLREAHQLLDTLHDDRLSDAAVAEKRTLVAGFRAKVAAEAAANQFVDEVSFNDHYRDFERALAGLDKRAATTKAQSADQAIRDSAVVGRLQGFTAEDAYDLAKVQQAFARSSTDQRVTTVAQSDPGQRIIWLPTARQNNFQTPKRYHLEGTPPTFGAKVKWDSRAMYLTVAYAGDDPAGLPAGQVGLVWNQDNARHVIFVTADGGRYSVPVERLELGGAAASHQPFLHKVLLFEDIETLAGAGHLPATLAQTIERARNAGNQCAVKIWDRSEPQFDKINRQNLLEKARRARIDQLNDEVSKKVHTSCAQHERSVDKAWNAANETRLADRKALYDAVKPRLSN